MITLTAEQAQQIEDALEYFNSGYSGAEPSASAFALKVDNALVTIRAARAQEQAEQPVSQEYQDHLVNQSFDWAAMAAKHQFMEGYRIGLAEMREKCAVICEAKQSYSAMHANTEFAAVIRSINFEGDTGFRPVSEMIAEHKQDPKKAAAIEKAKMRKAEQEPVAVVKRQVGNSLVVHITGNVSAGDLLYTRPVRTKDLTDEEQLELARSSVGKSRHWLVAAVIAKFKEKNKC